MTAPTITERDADLARATIGLLVNRTDGPGNALRVLALVVGAIYKASRFANRRAPSDPDAFWREFRELADTAPDVDATVIHTGKA